MKCDTYDLDPTTRPLSFWNSVKVCFLVPMIPIGAALIVALVGLMIVGF